MRQVIAYSDSGSGTYLSTTLFPKLGIADEVAGKSRKVRGPPSGEPVAAVVARGEAEIGFQQVSELIHVPGITFVGTLPTEVQPMIFFAGALASTVQQPEAASALIRFLIARGSAGDLEGRADATLKTVARAIEGGIGVALNSLATVRHRQSGHRLVHCTCPLLGLSRHGSCIAKCQLMT